MNKPASELIALADNYLRNGAAESGAHELIRQLADCLRTAANQSGSERATIAIPPDDEVLDNGKLSRPPEVTAAIAERTARLKELQDRYKNPVNPLRALATPPAQPAPAATHGKPDGAVWALEPWRDELSEIIGHLGSAIVQSCAKDDQIIMDHVKAAHEIAKIVRRKA